MSAEIFSFRRNIPKLADELIALTPGTTAKKLLSRHRQGWNLRKEALAQYDEGHASIDVAEEVTCILHGFHRIALKAGIPKQVVGAFNAEREDWKMIEAWRQTLPPYQRM